MRIEQFTGMSGIKPETLKPAVVKPMTDLLTHTAKAFVKPKECYYNAAMMVNTLWWKSIDAEYVLGAHLSAGGMWIPHAWVLVEGEHFDPTLNRPDHEYQVIKTFPMDELSDHLQAHDGLPPNLDHLGDEFYTKRPDRCAFDLINVSLAKALGEKDDDN